MIAFFVLATFPIALLAGALVSRYPSAARLAAYLASTLGGDVIGGVISVAASRPHVVEIAWAPSLGLSLSFNFDGLGLLFALLIAAIGALVVLYASAYLENHAQARSILRVALRLHGRDARCRAERQHPHAICVLGTHRIHFVPAHRIRT